MINISDNIKKSKPYNSVKSIIKSLLDAGCESYIVGGAVRDLALNIIPKEYDICTSATPEQINNIFKRTKLVGQSFGVSIVVHNDIAFELATFRQEFDYSDGRHPDKVEYTLDVRDDIKRRDFTVNGLLLNPLNEELIDHCGGISDLENKRIRTIGNPNERFNEDHLRILRAIRFSNHLNFHIDDDTKKAMTKTSRYTSMIL